MTPTVIEVITSNEAVHANADAELGVTLTPLSATLEKLLPSQAKVANRDRIRRSPDDERAPRRRWAGWSFSRSRSAVSRTCSTA